MVFEIPDRLSNTDFGGTEVNIVLIDDYERKDGSDRVLVFGNSAFVDDILAHNEDHGLFLSADRRWDLRRIPFPIHPSLLGYQ